MQFTAPGGRAGAARGIAIAGGVALVAFLVANPYAVLDWDAFANGLTHQSDASGDAAGKLGLTQDNGYLYYLWSFGWGLGWIPLSSPSAGRCGCGSTSGASSGCSCPAVVAVRAVHGLAGALLRPLAHAGVPVRLHPRGVRGVRARRLAASASASALKPTIVVAAVVALCAQGFVYSLHSGLVLSREDTRNLAREWMVANVPLRLEDRRRAGGAGPVGAGHRQPVAADANGNRWLKYPDEQVRRSTRRPGCRSRPAGTRLVNIEDFERVLAPELVSTFEQQGYC